MTCLIEGFAFIKNLQVKPKKKKKEDGRRRNQFIWLWRQEPLVRGSDEKNFCAYDYNVLTIICYHIFRQLFFPIPLKPSATDFFFFAK